MAAQNDLKSEIKTWLESSQIGKEFSNFDIVIEGTSEKGDGYMGDILFVKVRGTTHDDMSREYDLVLKCSKRSQALRNKIPIRESFENESYHYKVTVPTFQEFERNKGISDVFDYVPKYFGTYKSEDMIVIIFENLKKQDYILLDPKVPVSAKHNELVVKAYGRWHATGAAIRDQNPEQFQRFASNLTNVWKMFIDQSNFIKAFETSFNNACENLIDSLGESVIEEFGRLRKLIPLIGTDFVGNSDYFTTITHGDCWCNNFLYQHKDGNINVQPSRVAILDWQTSCISSPVIDLSYYLHVCISEENLSNIDEFLNLYYKTFSEHLIRLGSDPEKVYPLKQFREEWKIFAIYGIFFTLLITDICYSNKEDLPDMMKAAENGEEIHEHFCIKRKPSSVQIDRWRYIVEYVVRNGLVRERF